MPSEPRPPVPKKISNGLAFRKAEEIIMIEKKNEERNFIMIIIAQAYSKEGFT